MLDVHAPHPSAHSWRDFLIHIATICVGLLIAIGLEQTVETFHQHHQREDLEQQIHDESQRNLDLVRTELAFVGSRRAYLDRCIQALATATPAGDKVVVTMPVNDVSFPAGMLISPSQATWSVARSAGTVALLPAEEAKVYTRLNLVGDFELESETRTVTESNNLVSAKLRDHLPGNITTPVPLTTAQRDDLLYAFGQAREAAADLKFRLAILEGALEAVLAKVHTLEDMYPYHQRAILRENAKGINARSHETSTTNP